MSFYKVINFVKPNKFIFIEAYLNIMNLKIYGSKIILTC